MSEQWPAPTPRDEMLARVVVRGRRIRMINRIILGAAVGAVATAGAAGLVLGYSGTLSFSRGAEASVSAGSLTYFACPNAGVQGTFQPGDRVYLTGRDETGAWVQVRSPEDQAQRVWVQGEYVHPDEVVDLPLAGCADGPLEVAAGPVEATTTTTTEALDEELPGEEPDPPATTTTAPPTTTTTQAPTTTATTTTTAPAPVIGSVSVSPSQMVRRLPPADSCGLIHNGSETGTVHANAVTNAASVTWVARIGGQQIGQGSLSPGAQAVGSWQGPIGPFPGFDGPDGLEQVVQVTVTATGATGSVNRNTSFVLVNCWPLI